MSGDPDYPAIVVAIGGRPQRLSTPKQWRVAIRERQVERDTMLAYERAPGLREHLRAGDCEPLKPLFAQYLGPEPSSPAPAPVSASSPEPSAPATRASPWSAGPAPAVAPAQAPAPAPVSMPASQAAPPARRSRVGCWVVLAIAVLAAISWLTSGSGGTFTLLGKTPRRAAGQGAATYYAQRDARVHVRAAVAAPTLAHGGPLRRGEAISGVPADGHAGWVRIVARPGGSESGGGESGSGGYVARSLLGKQPPDAAVPRRP